MELTELEEKLLITAFMCGFEVGYDETYRNDSFDLAKEWIEQVKNNGILDHLIDD